jgi:hypothetical protein
MEKILKQKQETKQTSSLLGHSSTPSLSPFSSYLYKAVQRLCVGIDVDLKSVRE